MKYLKRRKRQPVNPKKGRIETLNRFKCWYCARRHQRWWGLEKPYRGSRAHCEGCPLRYTSDWIYKPSKEKQK